MATTKLAEAQLVFVPTPGIGHLVSAIHFAKLILEHDNRISILDTFVENQSRNNPYPSRLTFATLPPVSTPPDFTSPVFFRTILTLNQPSSRRP
ncbi:UDP-glycosyltransferase 71D1 [Bienertia sinuspersici]